MKTYGWVASLLLLLAYVIVYAVPKVSSSEDLTFWFNLAFGGYAILCVLTFVLVWQAEKRKEISRSRQVDQWQEDVIDRFSKKESDHR